jgi:hypothetical protein
LNTALTQADDILITSRRQLPDRAADLHDLVITLTMCGINSLSRKFWPTGNMDKIRRVFGQLFGAEKPKIFTKGLDKILTMWFTYSVASCRDVARR